MSRHNWLYGAALVCAILAVGGLALLTNSAQAQRLSGQASKPLSPAQQAMKADLGMGGPLGKRGWEGPESKPMAPTGSGNAAGAPKQPASASCWSVVSSPNPSPDFNQLYGTSAISPRDIWAVGADDNGAGGSFQALTEHWNGSAWSVVPSPNVGSSDYELDGVAAVASNDVWAVGTYYGTPAQTLTEHWNGRAWSVVPSANPGSANNYLNSVTAVSSNDVWAAGTYHVDDAYGPALVTLIEHWNGRVWSAVTSANKYPEGAANELNAITSVSRDGDNMHRDDLWAVGIACSPYTDCILNGTGTFQTMIEHWNGSTWSVVASPNYGTYQTRLNSVSGTSANDVWAVGGHCTDSDCNGNQSLTEHWNGRAWSIVPSPNPGSVFTGLFGVIAITPHDAWAVGSYCDENTCGNPVLHWNGTNWTTVTVTNPGQFDNDQRSLTAIGPNNVWVVGDFDNGAGEQTQVQHYDGPCR